jgi:hypothetical protein
MADLLGGLFGKKKREEADEIVESKPARPLTITIGKGSSGYGVKQVGSYSLTPLGKQKVRNLEDSDPNFLILATVEEQGASSLGEISTKTGMSTVKCNTLINGRYGLVAAGCLKKVGPTGE